MSSVDAETLAEIAALKASIAADEKSLANNPVCMMDTLKELAKLSAIEYDKMREEQAKVLGIRVGTMDTEVHKLRKSSTPVADAGQGKTITFPEVEEWPHSVDGAELLNNIKDEIQRYVILYDYDSVAAALFVMFTYLFQSAICCPLLAVQSPEKRCGKTTLMSLLSYLVHNPLAASNISSAALFRVIEQYKPTLLIDEADSFLKENEELRGVLNSGHTRATAFVIRTTGDNHEPKQFSTWGPKIIALIGKLPDTLSDRSITINLKRKKSDEVVERLRLDQTTEFQVIKSKCLRWANDYNEIIKKKDPDVPTELNDRAADNWRPLLAIADLAGGEWPQKAREAAIKLSGGEVAENTASIMLLEDFKTLFEHHGDKVPTNIIIEGLCENEERPWVTWNRGKPVTSRQIARLLNPFGILSKTIRLGSETSKGYEKQSFIDAFSRYLSAGGNLSVTPSQVNVYAGLRGNSSVTSNNDVTDRKDSKSSIYAGCDGVTAKKPVKGELRGEPFEMEVEL